MAWLGLKLQLRNGGLSSTATRWEGLKLQLRASGPTSSGSDERLLPLCDAVEDAVVLWKTSDAEDARALGMSTGIVAGMLTLGPSMLGTSTGIVGGMTLRREAAGVGERRGLACRGEGCGARCPIA